MTFSVSLLLQVTYSSSSQTSQTLTDHHSLLLLLLLLMPPLSLEGQGEAVIEAVAVTYESLTIS